MICIAAAGRSQRTTIAVYSIPGIPGHDSTYAAMAGIAVYSGGHGKAQWLGLQCTMAGIAMYNGRLGLQHTNKCLYQLQQACSAASSDLWCSEK